MTRFNSFTCTCLVLSFFFLIPGTVLAERHAVLIAVKDYQDTPAVPALFGPVNDVRCLKDMLVSRYGFDMSRITTLVNNQATRSAIMNALQQLLQQTRAGDFILIYFSGHGASVHDTNLPINVGMTTGALVPWDFKIDKKNPAIMVKQLIIGKRDLRPIFTRLDVDRKVLVIFDACYSQNTSRAQMEKGIDRALPLGGLDDEPPPEMRQDTAAGQTGPEKPEPYPYRNVVYFAASAAREPAQDFRRTPFDGQAHGGFTSSLLMGLQGAADLNHDGQISYSELFQYSRLRTTELYSRQSPQLFPDNPVQLNQAIGDIKTPKLDAFPDGLPSKLRVMVQGEAAVNLSNRLKAIPEVTLAENDNDLLVKSESAGISVYLAGGERLLASVRADEALDSVRRYAGIRGLVRLQNPRQSFNVEMQIGDTSGRAVFFEGEPIRFTLRSTEDAYLLLLNIDSHGYVTLLIPEGPGADTTILAGQLRNTPVMTTIQPPFGLEYVKLFAFREKPVGLERFAGGTGTLNPDSPELRDLIAWITARTDYAETVFQVITTTRQKNEQP